MIMDFSRKYRKYIWWFLIVMVGVPFIFITTGNEIPFLASLLGGGPEYGIVAQVGDQPVTAEEFRQQLQQRAAQVQPEQTEPDYKMLAATGEADSILDSLVNGKILANEVNAVDMQFEPNYLDEVLKKVGGFQNEKGEFDARLWNDWVQASRDQNVDWNDIRSGVAEEVKRRVLLGRVTASARVRDQELREAFEKANTKVKVKYLTVQPKVTPTEEQIAAHYETNKTRYDLPAKRRAEFVSISVEPARPVMLDSLVERARGGEALEEIAKTTAQNVSIQAMPATDWMTEDKASENQKALFTMTAGQVTDPVQTELGYSIYKLVEERTNPDTGAKEIRAQELAVYPQLSSEERKAAEDRANALATQAKTSGDLAAAAVQSGLQVQTTGEFTVESTTIDGVPEADAARLARALAQVDAGAVSDVITTMKNLYVAKVTEVQPPVPQPLEAVRDKVVEDTIAEMRQQPDYQTKVVQLAQEIAGKVKSLDEVKALYPDLDAEVKEVGPFSPETYSFSDGPFWNPQEVVQSATEAGPGKVVGPVRDFMGGMHLVELVEATKPEEKAWQDQAPAEKDRLRQQLVMARSQERIGDYLTYLRNSGDIMIRQNEAVVREVLGLDPPAGQEGTEQPAAPAEEAAPIQEGGSGVPGPPAMPAPVAPVVPSSPSPAATQPDGSLPTPADAASTVEPAAPAAEAPAAPATEAPATTPEPAAP